MFPFTPMRALCDLGVGVRNLESGKIGAIFIKFLWGKNFDTKKISFVLGNAYAIRIDCMLL